MATNFKTGFCEPNWINWATYEALQNKDPYALYIIKDRNLVFRGETPLMDIFAKVDAFDTPYTGALKPKTLCYKLSDQEGEPILEVRMLNEQYGWDIIVPPVKGFIDAADESLSVPTSQAVVHFVGAELDRLTEYFNALDSSMQQKLETAQGYLDQTSALAGQAAGNADEAATSALYAESYAKGHTGIRDGENTDNAEYYKNIALQAAGEASGDTEAIAAMKEAVEQMTEQVSNDKQDVADMKSDVTDMKSDVTGMKRDVEASQEAAALSEQNAGLSEQHAKASEEAAETAQDKAEDAQQAAEGAQTAAETAQSAAETAQGKAETAQGAAETAQGAAEIAQGKAEDAQSAAETAQGKAEDAQTAAETAQDKAEDAQTAAETAQGKAEDAQQAAETAQSAAETAQGKAEDAQTAAETAQGAAETAQSAAETAQDKAEDAQTAAETAQGAAETAQGAAETAQGAAETAQGAAEGSATAAANSALLSKSWAVGDTGVRDDEDENNAKYWAEQSRQASPDGKADKVLGGDTDGMVAGLDAAGNLTNTGVPSDNVAQKNGYYAAEDFGAATAENLIDPNATPEPASFGFRTSAGDLSITDGTGVMHTQFGSTEIVNQIVAPSTAKDAQAVDGVVEVSDAVGGNALTLKMTAPRSVVVNQLVENGDFSDGTNGWSTLFVSVSASNNICTMTVTTAHGGGNINASVSLMSGHVYLISLVAKSSVALNDFTVRSSNSSGYVDYLQRPLPANTQTALSNRFTLNTDASALYVMPFIGESQPVGTTVEVSSIQLIDLTQYFNGDQTLIDSITTWDDLVAYDPRFAQYVEYNTGEVVGVQPTVKVTGKNLFNPQLLSDIDETIRCKAIYVGNQAVTASSNVTSIGNRLYLQPDIITADEVSASYVFKQGVTRTVQPINGWVTIAYRIYRDINPLEYNIQLELGSTATSYETYHDGGTAQAPATLFAVGDASDEFEAVSGVTTHSIGSYTFDGTETWDTTNGVWFTTSLANSAKFATGRMIIANDKVIGQMSNSSSTAYHTEGYCWLRADTNYKRLYVIQSSITEPAAMATFMTGVTVYFEKAEPTTSSSTPTQISLQAGNNTAMQTDGGRTLGSLELGYDGTEYDLKLVNGSKYIIVDNGAASYRTVSSSNNTLSVHGGSTMVHNLTQWFGKGYEPASVDAFYARYPSLKGYAMAYNQGSAINYKGTAVRTEGFNFYNPATGTARLLGGNEYQICGTYTSCSYVDRWGNTEELDIDEEGIFTPVDNGTLTVVGGNATDTCVHLTWSGYRNYGKEEYKWEPFWQVTTPLNVLESFPQGMNGIRQYFSASQNSDVRDEYTATGYVKRIGIVDGGELSYGSYVDSASTGYPSRYPWGYAQVFMSDKKPGVCNFMSPEYATVISYDVCDKSVLFQSVNATGYIIDSSFIGLTGAQIKERMTGVKFYYELATPVTVTFPETRLISYSVSDFGTEELLPADDEPGVPSTTWLDGRIQYQQDFLRLLINYSKIYSVVKHIADNADRLVYDDDTAPNLIAGNAYNLIDREAQGTMREFSYDSVNGTNDVTDGTAIAQSVYGQTLMANQLVQDSVQKTAQGTGQVEVEDAVAGDISSLVVEGRSLVKNQLVPPTMTNTKNSSDGRLGITDGVAGNAIGLTLRGGCVVHNQLVKESIAKTVTGTGRLGCSDGVAGNAESFVINAPRSVVMNQLVQNGDFSDGVTGWVSNHVLVSASDGTAILTASNTSGGLGTNFISNPPLAAIAGHVGLIFARFNTSVSHGVRIGLGNAAAEVTDIVTIEANKWTTLSFKGTFAANSFRASIYPFAGGSWVDGDTVSIQQVQVVDLTQYFNGNQTLINSITSWDDLVAYDPSFASYVPYNTGTVKGVQPTVKVNHATDVACPVELFGVSYTVGDSFDGVSGVVTRKVVSYTFTGNESWGSASSDYPGFWYLNIYGAVASASICSGYPLSQAVGGWSTMEDKTASFRGSTATYARFYVHDTAYTDASSFAAHMAGKTIYYELATPTTAQYNPTTIPTVDIYNSAVQTSNERLASLSTTYQGREQTIALDPTHTYVFNDNQTEDSLITGQSSIDAVGGEDMLVDITQFYNGDTTKISQIHRWASLSTRFHRYRDLMPYNPGTVEPDTPVVRNYPDEHAYGVVYDPNTSPTTLRWVELDNGVITEKASFAEFSSTPCHEIWRCVMDDLANRHVAYYLDDADSDKKYNGTRLGVTSDGTASVLTGDDGDVMSRFPIGYWDLDEDYNGEGKMLWLISDRPFMGMHCPAEPHEFFYVSPDGATLREQFVGSFKGVLCDADGNPLNTTEGALTQATGTSGTNKVRSIAGALPYVSVNLNDFTARAVRNGATSVNTKFAQWLSLLMFIEYGTLNTQSISQGYSNGIQNAFCFWRKSGRVNAGNGTAEIFADANSQDMDNFQSLKVGSTTVQRDTLKDADGRYAWSIYNRNASSTRYFTASPTPANGDTVYAASTGDTTAGTVSSYTIKAASARVIQWQYRGIENPFGETWTFEHGIQVYNDAALLSIKVNNVVYTRSPEMDGSSSRAYVNAGTYMWIGLTLPSNAHAFLDAELTQDSGYVATANTYVKYHNGYWETLATAGYTMTAQQTAANPAYTWRAFPWALSNGYVKKFDPMTFLAKTVGGSASTYLPDYFYTTTSGSRVVFFGGLATFGSCDGLAYRYVILGLTSATVYISGRLSA